MSTQTETPRNWTIPPTLPAPCDGWIADTCPHQNPARRVVGWHDTRAPGKDRYLAVCLRCERDLRSSPMRKVTPIIEA